MWSYIENTKPTYEDILFFQKEQHIEGAAFSFHSINVFLVSFAPLSSTLCETDGLFTRESWLELEEKGQSEAREESDTK